MDFSPEEIEEFKIEAQELLEAAEKSLLALDSGAPLTPHYDSIFRALHSIKGAAGMMEMTALQGHMHQLENIFTEHKGAAQLPKELADFFLRGLDGCRALLRGEKISFDYNISKPAPSAPVVVVATAPVPEYLGRILVVDDEPDLVEIISEILTSLNYHVLGTTDPLEALRQIKIFKPDTVVTDISMPKMDGFQLLAEIRRINPDLPVVFVSGHINKQSLLEAIDLGIYSVIEKPLDTLRIMDTCKNAVRKYRLHTLLNTSINLLMYQFSDLDCYLKVSGKDDIRSVISFEMTEILNQRRKLRNRDAA